MATGHISLTSLVLFLIASHAYCAYTELSKDRWHGTSYEIEELKRETLATLGFPKPEICALTYTDKDGWEPGLYRLKFTVSPSHVCDQIAWHGGLKLTTKGAKPVSQADWQGIWFARAGKPESKIVDLFVPNRGPVTLTLSAYVDPAIFDKAQSADDLKSGTMATPDISFDDDGDGLEGLGLNLSVNRKTSFYYAFEKAELQTLSRTAFVKHVSTDKIRYAPGATLKGTVALQRITGKPRGKLNIFLEHGVRTRELKKTIDVELTQNEQTFTFEIALPERELGHALVAQFISADGADKHERAEYFNIVDNIFRTAISRVYPIHMQTLQDTSRYPGWAKGMRHMYQNCREIFFWAEEDMVEMSPDTDYWFSGQTAYHMSKDGLKNLIKAYHDEGIAVTTYGKFIMSGYLGWKQAYDYPLNHKQQYTFMVGMWEGANVPALDRFRNKEFAKHFSGIGGLLEKGLGYLPFQPINPDPTPANVRVAAEEMIRAVDMFGWDGVRWDGHPRGISRFQNSCGGSNPEKYNYEAHKKTQMLVRYFKDIVNARYPKFVHGYNYIGAINNPNYDWAVEDFELDELCRGGGLLMDEVIKNHSAGKTFEWFVRNIQVQGDLTRERGGYLLGMGGEHAPRDLLIETIIWFAGGSRPMTGTSESREINRYGTRFSRYVFDENMRRIAKPDALLHPTMTTELWWDAFVYETPEEDGKRQLVVNLMNIPRKKRAQFGSGKTGKDVEWDLNQGTDPVEFEIHLPRSHKMTKASLIDPFSLEVEEMTIKKRKIGIPVVNLWKVLVLDMESRKNAPTLASLFGPPTTRDKRRANLKVKRREFSELELERDVTEVNRRMGNLFPRLEKKWWIEPKEFQSMSMPDRNKELLARREKNATMHHLLKDYPYGLSLPADLKLKEAPPQFGNMNPVRDGIVDVFYARGSMDTKLRLYDAFALLPRVQVHEARFVSSWGPKGYRLVGNISPRQIPKHDILVYLDIPHPAIGVNQCYAMVDYVKAGGSAFFIGGEYAFDKGRYSRTVIDRELLPIVSSCGGNRYTEEPLVMEPGEHFKELGVKADFACKPLLWCWNETALRPDADIKVFLKAGNRPMLVGWQLGKGRVACLLAMHRGLTTDAETAYFDWDDWPTVVEGLFRWLAPNATDTKRIPAKVSAQDLDALSEKLSEGALDDLFDESLVGDDSISVMDDSAVGEGTENTRSRILNKNDLNDRIKTIQKLLRAEGPKAGRLVAEQLGVVENLPAWLRATMITFAAENASKKDLTEQASLAVKDEHIDVRGSGYQLLALAGDSKFKALALSRPAALESDPIKRGRYMVMAIANYTKDDLLPQGKQRIAEWNVREKSNKEAYTEGLGFSLRSPEIPCLDTESLLSRTAWLAYMAKREPETYASQLAREWTRLPQYRDFCDRCTGSIHKGMANTKSEAARKAARAQLRKIAAYRAFLVEVEQMLDPLVDELYLSHGEQVAKGLVDGHFLLEIKQTMKILGRYPVKKTRKQHEILSNATHPELASFARTRRQL